VSINRLVGERVFGWAVRESEDEPTTWGTRRITRLDCQYHGTPIDSGPHFDRDIAAAMEVHGKCRLCILPVRMSDGSDGWQVRRYVDIYDATSTNHESLCMAICLAALRAVGVPEATIQEACK
jgi:hypothetical protein